MRGRRDARARPRAPAGEILLLENLRFHAEEEANDDGFARSLAELADCYVNDAFAAAHRAHASIAAITKHLQPAAAGLLLQQELAALGRILETPERPLVAILGGAKVSDKLALVEHLLARVDALLIGGGMAFTFLRAIGHTVGRSLVETGQVETARRTLEAARRQGVAVLLPVDAVVADGLDSAAGRTVGVREIPDGQMGLDIGPAHGRAVRGRLKTARTVVWNGPMGVFEKPPFAAGTIALGCAPSPTRRCSPWSAAATRSPRSRQAGVAERIGYISDGGRRVPRVPRGAHASRRRGVDGRRLMRTPLVIGNWKMHGTLVEARALAGAIRDGLKRPRGVQVVVCPPFTALARGGGGARAAVRSSSARRPATTMPRARTRARSRSRCSPRSAVAGRSLATLSDARRSASPTS